MYDMYRDFYGRFNHCIMNTSNARPCKGHSGKCRPESKHQLLDGVITRAERTDLLVWKKEKSKENELNAEYQPCCCVPVTACIRKSQKYPYLLISNIEMARISRCLLGWTSSRGKRKGKQTARKIS